MKPGEHDNGHLDRDLEQVVEAYRDTTLDEPPALLDQAVLNRARRDAASKSFLPWNFGWVHAITTTAVVILGLALVMQLPEDPTAPPAMLRAIEYRDPEATRTQPEHSVSELRDSIDELAAPGEGGARAQKSQIAEMPDRSRPAGRPDDAPGELESAPKPREEEAGPATLSRNKALKTSQPEAAAPGPAMDEAASQGVMGSAVRQQAGFETDGTGGHAEPGKPAGESRANATAATVFARQQSIDADREDPEDWLRRIQEMLAAGERETAGRELAAFREAFPDYEIPPHMATLLDASND